METGIVFDIQHYCVHDGPGIRTVVFLKGCPLRCAWCHNPESQKLKPEIGYLNEKCTGCGNCARVCPENAIKLADTLIDKNSKKNTSSDLTAEQRNSLTAHKLIRDKSICTVCGKCASVCESGATQILGREMNAGDVVDTVMQDKPFYDNSGGGVTFSGGEPTLQKAFLLEMLERSKETGIHTAIETCGYFDSSLIDELVPLIDLFLFDLKQIDTTKHRESTGKDNKRILDNFISILKKTGNKRIVPRIPLIPGVNTDNASIDMLADFLILNGFHEEINLMAYNPLSKSKYDKIGRSIEYKEFGDLDTDKIQQITGRLAENGLKAVCQK